MLPRGTLRSRASLSRASRSEHPTGLPTEEPPEHHRFDPASPRRQDARGPTTAHFTAEDTWINALQTPSCNLIMVGAIRLSLPMVVI